MGNISARDRNVVWHPYTPMKLWPDAIAITRGSGAWLIDEKGDRYLDAISSWWVNLHGHSHPYIAKRVAAQMTTLEHCIFAGFTHEPAVQLAERLLRVLPGNMQKIFYSDNGSTAVEVAIKMAVQYWANTGTPKMKIVALENAYHGDTFGAMAVSARSTFNASFADYLFDVSFIPTPTPGCEKESITALEAVLANGDVAAFIAEPLIQGSAGMIMYSPDALEQLFATCRKHNTLIIADEVMTGFGRTGKLFACENISSGPDIICLSKGLTGGFLPMGVTATTQQIFDAFYDDDKSKMLYHGHSYTANATTCAAALASLDLLLADECHQSRERIIQSHKAFAESISGHKVVTNLRQTGTILAMDINSGDNSYHSNIRDRMYRFFLDKKVLLRPLGNVLYILPPYCITDAELEKAYTAIRQFLESESGMRP
jgi:adenosylmethionine---8-amino-7-oxononanoate aminotransferase